MTDYAIYMLDPTARDQLEPRARSASRATRPTRSSASISRGSTPTKIGRRDLPAAALETARARASSKARAGGSARTEAASGPMSSSIPSGQRPARLVGFAKITRDLTERKAAEEALRRERGAVPAAGAGRHRLRHLHAGSDRPRDATGTPARNASRAISPDEIIGQHFSRFYTEEDRAARRAGLALADGGAAKDGSKRKAGGSARTAPGSGPTSSSMPIRNDAGRADRLRQDHPRHHRAAGSAASSWSRPARRCSSRRRWMPSASSPAASRTTSTTC